MSATGILATPMQALADLLAGLSAWQTWTGQATAEDAAGRVLWYDADPDVFPVYALLDFGRDYDRERTSGAPNAAWRANGNMEVTFRAAVDAGSTDQEAAIDFSNNLGAVWRGLENASNQTNIMIARIAFLQRPARTWPEDLNFMPDYYQATLEVTTRSHG